MFSSWNVPNAALPPDVILEVGPHPCSTRYAAHGSLLAVHSGYLRAALRTVESNTANTLRRTTQHNLNSALVNAFPETCPLLTAGSSALLYLPNLTTEQFTPLLTYMYTGYLDLTMDNIFGVLLATHLLHMPRALELCRTYLSSPNGITSSPCAIPPGELVQRGYFGLKTNATVSAAAAAASAVPNGSTLVRPIASKALTTVGLNFIAPPTASQINLLPSATFRSLASSSQTIPMVHSPNDHERDAHSQSPINVTQYEDETPQLTTKSSLLVEKVTTDEENTSEENEPIQNNATLISSKLTTTTSCDKHRTTKQPTVTPTVKRHRSQVDVVNDGVNGVIIDIASCDGPVRFRRVLNVMYGCNRNNQTVDCTEPFPPELAARSTDGGGSPRKIQSRYASSFHQQMARTISNTGKLTTHGSSSLSPNSSYQKLHHQPLPFDSQTQQPHAVVGLDQKPGDENSQQEDNTPYRTTGKVQEENSNYTCVYCKHTFKSHYCYQKHAKRHLIPLRLEGKPAVADSVSSLTTMETTPLHTSAVKKDLHTSVQAKPFGSRNRSRSGSPGNSGNSIKREVKPLDMNVQYFPCKTCGSKFPSYYFVHKHRKLCHTEEEDDMPNHESSSVTNSTRVHSHDTNPDANDFRTEHSSVSEQSDSQLKNRNPHPMEQQG